MNIKFIILIGIISVVLFFGSSLHDKFLQNNENYCTDTWYITGYYLPVESDYLGELITVEIDGTKMQFQNQFVNQVKIEGWGMADSGKYLGWYNDKFHLNKFPLDYFGNELVLGTIAVDPTIIELNATVSIPTLPEPWNNKIFRASDTGIGVKGNHIDVYTGKGRIAEKETMKITGHHTVCFLE